MFTDIFMMRHVLFKAGIDYKSGALFIDRIWNWILTLPEKDNLQVSMLDESLILHIKKFSLHLAVTLSRSEVLRLFAFPYGADFWRNQQDARSFLLDSIIEAKELDLLKFLGSCLSGNLQQYKEVFVCWRIGLTELNVF